MVPAKPPDQEPYSKTDSDLGKEPEAPKIENSFFDASSVLPVASQINGMSLCRHSHNLPYSHHRPCIIPNYHPTFTPARLLLLHLDLPNVCVVVREA